MHDHFYHWHQFAELKPEVPLLKVRWDAAKRATEALNAEDLCDAIQLALVPETSNQFSSKFSAALVKLEPTFPHAKNTELLRVMVTAGLFEHMSTSTRAADAIALGIRAGSKCGEVHPICPDLLERAEAYLSNEAEIIRAETDHREDFEKFRELVKISEWHTEDEALIKVGAAILELGNLLDQLNEENQFLWWLNVRRSPQLETRRMGLKPKDYAFVAAKEAAERVKLIPPPESAISILEEVMSQCSKGCDTALKVGEILRAGVAQGFEGFSKAKIASAVCPLSNLQMQLSSGKGIDEELIAARLGETKLTPSEASKIFFNELVFMKSLEYLS